MCVNINKNCSMNKSKINFVVYNLRKISLRWHTRSKAIKRARVERGLYRCDLCGYMGKRGEFELDHKIPVIDVKKGFTTFDEYIDRLLPDEVDGWQFLCKTCHDKKTAKENKKRKKRGK